MKNLIRFVLLIMVFLKLLGCSGVMIGMSDRWDLGTDPAGAKVFINNRYLGDTPLRVKLQIGQTYRIHFQKKGYASVTGCLTHPTGGWVIIDVLRGLKPVVYDIAAAGYKNKDNGLVEPWEKKSKVNGINK